MTERRHFEHVQMSMCSQLKLNYVSKLFLMYLNSCFLLLLQDKSWWWGFILLVRWIQTNLYI